MTNKWTLLESFASFDAKGLNPRWSWSARSDDGKTVVLALWQDEFEFVKGEKGVLKYHSKAPEDVAESMQRPGNRERLKNLKWAKDHCDGLFRVVILIARDKDVKPREIGDCFPRPDLVMRIVELDEDTGEFRAVRVNS